MNDPQDEISIQLSQNALETYMKEYAELSETWRHLDSKAGTTVTISGVVLGAVFVFVQAKVANSAMTWTGMQKTTIIAAIILLSCSILFSILALRIRNVSMGVTGENLHDMVNDLKRSHDLNQDRISNFYNDQMVIWQRANEDIHKANNSKARWILASHIALFISMLMFTINSIISIN